MCIRHAHNPPKMIQMMLSGTVMQPDSVSVSLTSAPKGHRQSSPSLKVCIATGMPTMVKASAKLPEK